MTVVQIKQPPWLSRITAVDAAGAMVAVILTLVLFLAVIAPESANIKQRTLRESVASRERQHLATIQNALHRAEWNFASAQQAVDASPRPMLALTGMNTRLSELASLAKECGVTVAEMKPGDEYPFARFAAIPIHMAGRATYRACALYMHLVHDRFYDVGIFAFKMTGTPERPDNPCAIELELRWLASGNAEPVTTLQLHTASSQ